MESLISEHSNDRISNIDVSLYIQFAMIKCPENFALAPNGAFL